MTANDLDELSVAFKDAVERQVSGTFVSVSQPIEDRTNELISGSRADVAIQVFGPDIDVLVEKSAAVGAAVRYVNGTGDVRIERLLGMPSLAFTPDRERLARYGVALEDALRTLEAARVGAKVGTVYEDARRYEVRLMSPPETPSRQGLSQLPVETSSGVQVRLAELGAIADTRRAGHRAPGGLSAHGAHRGEPARARSRELGRRGEVGGGARGAARLRLHDDLGRPVREPRAGAGTARARRSARPRHHLRHVGADIRLDASGGGWSSRSCPWRSSAAPSGCSLAE